MQKALPIALLLIGLLIVGFGLMEKDDHQATLDLGQTEIQLGKWDSAFSAYFVVGGIAAVAGLVLLLRRNKA